MENSETIDRMAGKTYLSTNERMVLLGLVKFPDLNDRQIAERVGLKLSTFTAIKNRLKKNDYFQSVRHPNMGILGSELLFVLFANLSVTPKDKDKEQVVEKFLKQWSDVFYAVAETERMVAIGYSSNYTSFRQKADEMIQVFSAQGVILKGTQLRWVLFPLDMSVIMNNFNHTRIIEDHFGVEYKPHQVGDQYDMVESLKMGERGSNVASSFTTTELKVLQGLIHHPDLPDNKVAMEVGTTRQAVARIKKKLDKKRIIRSIRIPNLKKLGFEIITFTHMSFIPTADFSLRMETLNKIIQTSPIPVIFHISKEDESTILSAHRNYEEFNLLRSLVYNMYSQENYFKSEPTVILFSNADLNTIKTFEFSQMVKKVLEE